MTIVYQKVCPTGLFPAGLQRWEDLLSVFRLVCALVTVSIISSWYSRGPIGRLRLLFLHWVGGLVHLLSGIVVAQLVLNCWIGEEFICFVKVLKFLEQAGSNLVAVTNLAICANLGLIVHSHRTMSRYSGVSSTGMMFFYLATSVGFAASAIPFWDTWAVTGTSFYAMGLTSARDRWVTLSYFLLEAVAAVAMTIIVVLLLLFRRAELFEVLRLHGRIKFHVALTTIALLVDITITVAGVLIVVHKGPWLFIISWTLRFSHIALDTLVLYSALETPLFNLEINVSQTSSSSIPPRAALRY